MNKNELVLIYDADCPMCKWYSNEFIKHDLLSESGRESYQKIGPYTKTAINMEKARNHIALLNKSNGKVFYGYESLIEILSQKWKWIKQIGQMKMIVPMISFLYDLISYNRKIIAPSERGYLSCIPDKNPVMRAIFIFICMLGVEITAGHYFTQYFSQDTYYVNVPFRESLLFISQLVFLSVSALILKEKNLYDYLGHVSLVGLMGGIILWFFHLAIWLGSHLGIESHLFAPIGLGAVVMWMFLSHKNRIANNNFKPNLSYAWLLFRVILFSIIFKIK